MVQNFFCGPMNIRVNPDIHRDSQTGGKSGREYILSLLDGISIT